MRTLSIISLVALFMCLSSFSFGQKVKSESIPVSGNCGMCKAKIEKAALSAGAKDASWDAETQLLKVKYNQGSASAAKIQQAVAAVGYDTRDVKASDEAYNNLHGCCKYDRAASGVEKKADCCKDGKCSKPGHDGADCCKAHDEAMDCCKDGKCSKPGHDGKGCCAVTH